VQGSFDCAEALRHPKSIAKIPGGRDGGSPPLRKRTRKDGAPRLGHIFNHLTARLNRLRKNSFCWAECSLGIRLGRARTPVTPPAQIEFSSKQLLSGQASFDSAGTSLREVPATLKMTSGMNLSFSKADALIAAVNRCGTQKQLQKIPRGHDRGSPPCAKRRARMGHPLTAYCFVPRYLTGAGFRTAVLRSSVAIMR
jgi:hypothetical protein